MTPAEELDAELRVRWDAMPAESRKKLVDQARANFQLLTQYVDEMGLAIMTDDDFALAAAGLRCHLHIRALIAVGDA